MHDIFNIVPLKYIYPTKKLVTFIQTYNIKKSATYMHHFI